MLLRNTATEAGRQAAMLLQNAKIYISNRLHVNFAATHSRELALHCIQVAMSLPTKLSMCLLDHYAQFESITYKRKHEH